MLQLTTDVAAIAVLALLTASCGGDDGTETLSATTVATPVPTTTGTPEPSTVSRPPTSSSTTSVAPTPTDRPDHGDEMLTLGPQVEGTRVLLSQFDQPISMSFRGSGSPRK